MNAVPIEFEGVRKERAWVQKYRTQRSGPFRPTIIFVGMPHRQLIRDVQAGTFKPVYLLHGEEPFFIDEIAKALEAEVVEESMRDFNQTILYGRDSNIDQVLDPPSWETDVPFRALDQCWNLFRTKSSD